MEKKLKAWAKNREISVKDGYLYFGKIKTNWEMKPEDMSIPRLWVIRQNKEPKDKPPFYGLVTTLDIFEEGYWMCGTINITAVGNYDNRRLPSAIYRDMDTIAYMLYNYYPLSLFDKRYPFRVFVEEQPTDFDYNEIPRETIDIYE